MKELKLNQKKRALKYILKEFRNAFSADYICENFQYWYEDNISEDLNYYEYMKSFPELLAKIEKRLEGQHNSVVYDKKGEIYWITCLDSGKMDSRKYRIKFIKQLQKEMGI